NILATLWDFEGIQLLHTDDLIDEACSRLTRNLTRSEWEQYIAIDDEATATSYRPLCPNLPYDEENSE
ncbi:MAG: hypothetical protein GY796_11045, partial [Chloroflexi bacterium]|nr:hypothetical protein [Chloroflexota bacterium]